MTKNVAQGPWEQDQAEQLAEQERTADLPLPRPWTEAHRREAHDRAYELAAELMREDRPRQAYELLEAPWNMAQEEATWRADLGCAFDATRVDREVRRVRALAEGRLVRETTWFVRYHNGTYSQTVPTREQAVEIVGKAKGRNEHSRIVRVTRIRRP